MTEILLAFFAAMGVILVLWCLMGLLLQPVFGEDMVTIYQVDGDGDAMEQRVRAYGWFRDGRVNGGKLIIVDRGLSAKGKKKLEILLNRYGWLEHETADDRCLDGQNK